MLLKKLENVIQNDLTKVVLTATISILILNKMTYF